jgi:hypothetical protein
MFTSNVKLPAKAGFLDGDRLPDTELSSRGSKSSTETCHMHERRTPDKLPDPWLFNSESLLRELDRCRELVLLVPAPTHATHFALQVAIDAIWNLRENLQYLLLLHGEGQRSFARKAKEHLDQQQKAERPQKAKRAHAKFA